MKQTPQIAEKLQSGQLNLTQVALVQTALRQQSKINSIAQCQKEVLLEKIEGQTQLETRRILQDTFPEIKLSSEKIAVRPKGKTIISFEVSEDEFKLIEMAKAVLSHACPTQQTKEVILKLCEKLIKSKTKTSLFSNLSPISISNPDLKQAPVQIPDDQKNHQTFISPRAIEKLREPIPAALRREIFKKANQQCEYHSLITHKRCEGKTFLEIDHIKPVAYGGKSTNENLRVLCQEHNKLAAENGGGGGLKRRPQLKNN